MPNDISVLMIGPLLFLYIKSLFLKEENLIKNSLSHFVPAALFAVFIAIPTIVYDIIPLGWLSYVHSDFIRIILKTEDIYMIGYLLISLRLLSKYRALLKFKYSNLTLYDFNWIKMMLIGALCIISFNFSVLTYEFFFGDFKMNIEFIAVATMVIWIAYLGYYGVYQSKVLLPDFLLDSDELNTEVHVNSLSDVKKEEFEVLKNRLYDIIENSKPYLDENLTLNTLAQQLSTTDKKLSTLLNQYMNTNFYDFINTYRVEEIKQKLQSEQYENYTLLGISYECGFKSKTSFNRVFKKETGLSPSAYKKSLS
ncbi:helix-turn-helix domain-containing protein [Aquimarina algiphila]|uniref:helix-turn-helix domain-containing protein n=1 Tax=Aquimarina algiphila TaxID=2047982 RepID=UPI00142F841F|nr:AraC family transcriptional regulator [Aquimarina algiphila]